jgi:hypothetical protein
MTSRDREAACPECGETSSRLIHTELVRTCNNDMKVAEWSECGRCHRWLALRLWAHRDASTR